MPTVYLTDNASAAIGEVKKMFKQDAGLDVNDSQAILWLHAHWKQTPMKMWVTEGK